MTGYDTAPCLERRYSNKHEMHVGFNVSFSGAIH